MLKIKKIHLAKRVAFGATGFPLGKRSPAELIDLAIIGQQSQDSTILDLFDAELPPVEKLQEMKLKLKIQEAKNKTKEIEQGKK